MSNAPRNLPPPGHGFDGDPRIRFAHHPGLDTDHGPDTTGHTAPALTKEQLGEARSAASLRYQRLVKDKLFDYTHPVDEYGPQGGNNIIANTVIVQPDYDMPEMITGVFVIIPVGCTLAQLQLGQRNLVLYSGAALTAPLIPAIPETGLILDADDQRQLTLTGALTTAPYLGLTGWALTRGQFT